MRCISPSIRAAAAKPADADAEFHLGRILVEKGSPDEAIAHLQRALQLNSDHIAARRTLGHALLETGAVDDAAVQFEKILQAKPGDAQACYDLGNTFVQKGNVGRALVCFQKAVENNPDYPDALNNLSWELATSPQASVRDGPRAVELAERANGLAGGGDPDILDTLAAAYAEVGRFEDAIRRVKTAIELARASGRLNRVAELASELKLYEAHVPFHRNGK